MQNGKERDFQSPEIIGTFCWVCFAKMKRTWDFAVSQNKTALSQNETALSHNETALSQNETVLTLLQC